ncbi:MAG TPA: IS110 family transposase [Bacteroidales bacterium]|nr:IS110 family transposase [Bacteroidales bacterium]
MKKLKVLNFNGQNIYVGIDCHLKSWKVTIYSVEFELTTFSQDPEPGILINYLKRNFPGAKFKCVYEAGFSGFWMQREFKKHGIDCIIAHPADIPTMDKEKKQKSDKIDSRKLSRSLKNNEIEGIYVPSLELQEAKSLVRTRERIVSDIVRVKNRIKFFLMYHGIKLNSYGKRNWSKKFMNELKSVKLKTSAGQLALFTFIKELEFLIHQEKELKNSIVKLSKEALFATNVRLLLTVPSIGITTAMIFLSEIGDIRRFKTLDQLCSYFALIPNTHSSGEKENTGRNTKRGNKFLKYIIIECAWVAVRKDPGLLSYYKKQIVNKEPNKAIIKVAKKLLNRIKTVLNEQIEYQVGLA